MRALGAVVGLVAIVALTLFWRASLDALMTQGQAVASTQIRSAENVMSLREDLRMRNVSRFAAELSAKKELIAFFREADRSGVESALASTSFGAGAKTVSLIDRRGNRSYGPGLQGDSAVHSPAVARALGGRAELVFLQPEDPVLQELGLPRGEVPMFIAFAPVSDGKDVLGLVTVAEALGQDFFQDLAQLVSVKVSFPGAAANFGNVPDAAMKIDAGPPQYVESQAGPVFAQRIDFRAPPSFLLTQAVAAVDASAVAERRKSLTVYFVGALIPLLALVGVALRRRG